MKYTGAFYMLLIIAGLLLYACYYDSEEYLYPAGSGSGCDTTNVTYSGTVAPLLTTHCVGCHNPASPSAGIDVSTYSTLLVTVNNGKLWGTINHDPGFSPMPKNGSKLSACNLKKIRKWIDNGAPNN